MFKKNFQKSSLSQKLAWIGVIALIVIGSGGFAYYRLAYLPAQAATEDSQMQTAIIRQGDLTIYASGTGTLIAQSEANFGFKTSGQVTKVNVRVGDVVEAGQVLGALESTSAMMNYEQAQRALDELTSPIAIATAESAVATALDTLATAKTTLQYLVSPAVQIWQERLADAEKALVTAQAEATNNPSAEANQKVKDAEEAVTLAQANLAEANNDYAAYIKATFTETETDPRTGEEKVIYYVDATGKRYTNVYTPSQTDIDAAQAAYDLAKATLEEAEIYLAAIRGEKIPAGATGSSLATFDAAKAGLQTAEEELENTQLLAPIAGTIMSVDLNVGDYVSSNSTVVTISDLTHPSLEVFFDESDWNNVSVGDMAEISFDILSNKIFNGQVVQVDPGLYTENNSTAVRAIIRLDQVDDSFSLPLGTSASVDVIGGNAQNAVLVPLEALNKNGDQYIVYVMENGVPTERVVEIGIQDTLYAEVLSGLEAGETVVTEGE